MKRDWPLMPLLRSYLAHMATYGGGFIVISWFLGYYELVTKYFIEHHSLAVICLVVHFVLFLIYRLARNDADRLIARTRENDENE